MVVLAPGLASLSQLESLNLFNSGDIDVESSTALGQALSSLHSLRFINLGVTQIGKNGSDSVVPLAQAFRHLSRLTFLDVSSNFIGSTDTEGAVALGNALQFLPSLTSLDVSANSIGLHGEDGEMALGQGFLGLPNLVTLNLGENAIGSTGFRGPMEILNALPSLLGTLQEINLSGMENVTWTLGAEALATFNNNKIRAACENELCSGVLNVTNTNTPSLSRVHRFQCQAPFCSGGAFNGASTGSRISPRQSFISFLEKDSEQSTTMDAVSEVGDEEMAEEDILLSKALVRKAAPTSSAASLQPPVLLRASLQLARRLIPSLEGRLYGRRDRVAHDHAAYDLSTSLPEQEGALVPHNVEIPALSAETDETSPQTSRHTRSLPLALALGGRAAITEQVVERYALLGTLGLIGAYKLYQGTRKAFAWVRRTQRPKDMDQDDHALGRSLFVPRLPR